LDNKALYRKTLGFSLRRALWDILCIVIVAGLSAAGFLIMEKSNDNGLAGLGIGAVIGIAVIIFILRFVSYYYKAGQIAMMTRGIVEGELPENVVQEGRRTVKERFATVAAFFAVTGVIKGIFNQLGSAISSVGEKIGGDTGSAVGGAVSGVINTIVSYLCDCCLGWVFFRKDVKAAKATCEGAVIFFRHGKTLAKNLGRIFGIGLVSLVIIGGIVGGIAYPILGNQTEMLHEVADEIREANAQNGEPNRVLTFLSDEGNLRIGCAALLGLIVWAIVHSVFIRPFVLTGVLRNYINSGLGDIPDEASFALLDGKSAKFKKLHAEAAA